MSFVLLQPRGLLLNLSDWSIFRALSELSFSRLSTLFTSKTSRSKISANVLTTYANTYLGIVSCSAEIPIKAAVKQKY